MRAECTTCKQSFETDHMGTQRCPHCGTEVVLEAVDETGRPLAAGGEGAGAAGAGSDLDAGAGQPGADQGAEPGAGPATEGEGGRSPWEAPGAAGKLAAYGRTLKLALLRPQELFEHMTTVDHRGAFSFAFVTSLMGGYVSLIWSLLNLRMQSGQLSQLSQLKEAGVSPKVIALIEQSLHLMESLYQGPAFLLLPLGAALGIFLMAGLYHLAAMMVGANSHGFSATFRAYCYAQAPQIFAVLPGCGGPVAGIWSLVLTGFALMQLQRISAAKAAAVVLLPLVLMCCLGCLAYLGVMAVVATQVGADGAGLLGGLK